MGRVTRSKRLSSNSKSPVKSDISVSKQVYTDESSSEDDSGDELLQMAKYTASKVQMLAESKTTCTAVTRGSASSVGSNSKPPAYGFVIDKGPGGDLTLESKQTSNGIIDHHLTSENTKVYVDDSDSDVYDFSDSEEKQRENQPKSKHRYDHTGLTGFGAEGTLP